MLLNLSKTFLTFSVSMLLVAASVTASDARSHAKREAQTQSQPTSYDQERSGECQMFHCRVNGG